MAMRSSHVPAPALRPGTTEFARRKLRLFLVTFFLALSVPLAFLIRHTYQQLEREQLLQQRTDAAEFGSQTNRYLAQLLKTEEQRPFEEYSFLNVAGKQLFKNSAIAVSPLAELPPRSSIPGILGYFQVDPDDTFSTPLLPQVTEAELSNPDSFGFTQSELSKRLDLQKHLQELLTSTAPASLTAKSAAKSAPTSTLQASPQRDFGQLRADNRERDLERRSPAKAVRIESADRLQPEVEQKTTKSKVASSVLTQLFQSDRAVRAPIPEPAQLKPDISGAVQAVQTEGSGNIGRAGRREIVSLPSQATTAEVQSALNASGGPIPAQTAPAQKVAAQKVAAQKGSDEKSEADLNEKLLGDEESASLPSGELSKDTAKNNEENIRGRSTSESNLPLPQRSAGIKIQTFEGEIDPLRLTALPSGHLAFYRKVWRNDHRYIQGFIVERKQFLNEVIGTLFFSSNLSNQMQLRVSHCPLPNCTPESSQQLILFSPKQDYRESSLSSSSETLPILDRSLDPPFESIQLSFVGQLAAGNPRRQLLDLLSLTISAVIIGGLALFYRLGMGQISLMQQRSDFVAAVSHELKTPLTSIRMYGEMLREGWVTDEAKKRSYYDFIFFESERLSRLISNVLQLAKLTAGDYSLPLKEFTTHQILDLVQSKVTSQTAAAGFELVFHNLEANVGTVTVLADEDALIQIFVNLTDNALKFASGAERKQIEVGCRATPGAETEIVFYVRDFGPGVAPDQMKKIFQLFYRAENELTRNTKGTGIGLALVKQLAEKMNAGVDLQNRTPGAEFQIKFKATCSTLSK